MSLDALLIFLAAFGRALTRVSSPPVLPEFPKTS